MKIELTIVEHFDKHDDKECQGDYHALSIWVGNQCVLLLGNHYDDKSTDQADGYVAALKSLGHEVTVISMLEADSDDGDIDGLDWSKVVTLEKALR